MPLFVEPYCLQIVLLNIAAPEYICSYILT